MMKQGWALFLSLVLAWSAGAQQPAAASETSWKQIKRNTAVVLFSGVGGAVLGLSTLSFYGKPEEHTQNISTGVLIGVLGGLAYVVSRDPAAQQPPPWSLSMDGETTAASYRWDF